MELFSNYGNRFVMHLARQDKRTLAASRGFVEQFNEQPSLRVSQQQLAGQHQQQHWFPMCEGDPGGSPPFRAEPFRSRVERASRLEAHLRLPVSGAANAGNKQTRAGGLVGVRPERPAGAFFKGRGFTSSRVIVPLALLLFFLPVQIFATTSQAVSGITLLDTRHVTREKDGVSVIAALDTRALSSMVTWAESGMTGLDSGGGLLVPVVQSINPSIVTALDERQWISVRGQNFISGAVVILRTGDEYYQISPERTQWVSPQEIRIQVNVTSVEAEWTAQVINPGGQLSEQRSFTVALADITPVGRVDFGVVAPGQSAEKSFVVRNRGNSSANLNVTISAPFSVINGPFSPIPAGGQQLVTIRYQPTQAGRHEKSVVFNLGSRSLDRVAIGRAAAAELPQNNLITGILYVEVGGNLTPVPGAPVDLRSLGGAMQGSRTMTDGAGRYRFEQVKPGQFYVIAQPPSQYWATHKQASETVKLEPQGTVNKDLTLVSNARIEVDNPKKLPIILVRGYGVAGDDESEYWEELRNHLRSKKFENVWDPNENASTAQDVVINGEKSLFINALALHEYITDKIAIFEDDNNGYSPSHLRIVAHSMGGLITRQYLYSYDSKWSPFILSPNPPVRDVIMLGTPHSGSILADTMAVMGIFDRADWDSTGELRTERLRNWDVNWPNDRGIRLHQLGGTTGTDCFWEFSPYPLGDIYITTFNPFGDKRNDGAVSILSTLGQYINETYIQGIIGPPYIERETRTCFFPSPNLSIHKELLVNHSCIRSAKNILEWVEALMSNQLTPIITAQDAERYSIASEATVTGDYEDMPTAQILYERYVLSGGNTRQVDMIIDPTASATLFISLSSTGSIVRLKDPMDNLIYQSMPAVNNGATVTESTNQTGRTILLSVATPTSGVWQVLIDRSAVGDGEDVALSAFIETPDRLTAFAPENVSLGADVLLRAGIWRGDVLTRASNVSVEVQTPSGSVTNLSLTDSGQSADGEAGDGLFAGYFMGASATGDYEMVFRATGTNELSGARYQRASTASMRITPPVGMIAGLHRYEAIDTQADGYAEAIQVDLVVNVIEPGDYSLSGRLVDDNSDAEIMANTEFSAPEAGSQIVSLLFTHHDLPAGAIYGPFTTRDIRLNRVTTQYEWADSMSTNIAISTLMYAPYVRILALQGNLDFGSVRIGESSNRQITLRNDGWGSLRVSELVLPTGFTAEFAGEIAPAQTETITVTFTPSEERAYDGALEVISDRETGDSSIQITALGLPEAISFAQWAGAAGLAGVTAGPGYVANTNGIPNFMAYIHNINPTSGIAPGDSNAWPRWFFVTSNKAFGVDYRLNPHAVGYRLDFETTDRLWPTSIWQTVAPAGIQSLSPDPLTDDSRYRAIMPLDDRTNGYFRLNPVIVTP